jgi:hypothetical protein
MPDSVAAPTVAQQVRQAHVGWLICSAEGDRDDVVEGRVLCLDPLTANPAEPAVSLEDGLSVDWRPLRLPESLRTAPLGRHQDLGRVWFVVARAGWYLGALPLAQYRVGASAAMRVDRSAHIRIAGLAEADPISFGA